MNDNSQTQLYILPNLLNIKIEHIHHKEMYKSKTRPLISTKLIINL